jgi:hypothetical protein
MSSERGPGASSGCVFVGSVERWSWLHRDSSWDPSPRESIAVSSVMSDARAPELKLLFRPSCIA